jgi:hypothetical protein
MIHVVGPTLTGRRVTLRSMQESDAGELRRLRAAPAVAEWWGPVEDELPLEDEPEATRMSILVDGRIAGLVQYGEEPDESSGMRGSTSSSMPRCMAAGSGPMRSRRSWSIC